MGVKIRSSAIVGGGGGGISGVKLPIIIVGVKIGSSTLIGMTCSSVIVKIGSSACAPFP